jgi:transcription initiation factor IIE alpha subunit
VWRKVCPLLLKRNRGRGGSGFDTISSRKTKYIESVKDEMQSNIEIVEYFCPDCCVELSPEIEKCPNCGSVFDE